MKINYGECSSSGYGPGVLITLDGNEVARAIYAYLVAQDVNISGPRTVSCGGKLMADTKVYVDPSGFVISKGKKYSGRGPVKFEDPYPGDNYK